MSQNSVYDLAFDKYGFLWAGTADGLNRYDGYNFVQYRRSAGKKYRINNTSVFSINADPEGKIWISGSEGLEILNPLNNKVTFLFAEPGIVKGSKWYYDSSSQKMFLFMRMKGVWTFDIHTLQSTKLDIAAESGFINTAYNLSVIPSGKQGELLLFPRGYPFIYSLNVNTNEINRKYVFSDSTEVINSTAGSFSAGSVVFVSCKNKTETFLTEFDISNKKIIRQKKSPGLYGDPFFKSALYLPALQRIVVTDFNRGLIMYDTAFNETGNYPNSTVLASAIKGLVYQCLIAKDNCLWMGSDPNGITNCDLSSQRFHHFKNNSSSSAPIVKGIFTDAKYNVYSCLLYEGVQVFDRNGNYLDNFQNIGGNDNEPLRLQAFNTIIPAGKDSVFIQCYNYFGFYNSNTGQHKNYKDQFIKANNAEFSDNIYNQSFYLGDGKLLSAWINKLWIADFSGTGLRLIPKDSTAESISALYAVNESTYFIGTDGGLYLSDKGRKKYYNEIGHLLIKQISHDSYGNYWICTTDGLWQLNGRFQVVKHHTTDNGLPNNFTYAAMQLASDLWISTNLGLCRMDIATGHCTNYTVADGLQSNEFNSGAYWKSPGGQIYFGGINGITQVNAEATGKTSLSFPTLIMQVKINDEIYKPDTAAWSVKYIELPYTQNSFSFDFSGILVEQSASIEYRYRMDGADKDWIYAGKNRSVRYAGLAPGTYHFRVSSSLNNKDWNGEAIITIDIKPPFWQTTWFRILAAVLSLLLTWIMVQRINKRRFRRREEALRMQQQLEDERQRISRDLHDNMGAYTSALLSNVQQLKPVAGDHDALKKMKSNAEHILSSLRETIWVLNNRSVTVKDFSGGFKNYCFNLLRNFEHIDFDADERIVNNKTIPAATAIHLNKILQEAFQNIVKHASATTIKYSVSSNELLEIIIEDNGQGFDISTGNSGNGIGNMKWRAEQAGYQLTIHSTAGKGTSIILKEQ